jgi:hypothetical protein
MKRALPPLLLAAGGLVGWIAAEALLPASAAPGLRSLLAVLPAVGGLLLALGSALGARRPGADEPAFAAAAILLAMHHGRLGLPGTERLAVVALFAIVALRGVRLAPALARALAPRPRWAAFAVAPLAVYLAVMTWSDAERPPDGDEPYYLLLAESLATDFDVDLADEYAGDAWKRIGPRPIVPQPGDPTGPGGEVYSRHEPLLPLLLVPFWKLGGVAGARFAMLLIAAAAVAAAARAAYELGARPRGVLRAWALAAFAPPVLLLSSQVWIEVPAALLVAIALAGLGRLERSRRWSRSEALVFALSLALLPLLKLRLLAVAVPLALVALAGPRRRRQLRLAVVGVVAAGVLVVLGINAAVWGNPLRMHTLEDLDLFDLPFERFVHGGVGLFFDVAFGLFAAAPLWLLLVPAVAHLLRERGAVALALAALVPYFVLVASRREWYGGWSPAFRYGVVALPALAAALALASGRRPGAALRVVAAALAAATALTTAALLAEPGWSYSVAGGGSSLVETASAGYGGDLVRLFPSAVRPRPATWIVPLAATLALLGATLLRGRRPRAAPALGVAALLALTAAGLAAAHLAPTLRIEVEDPWVHRSGGTLWPGPWVVDRTRFSGGWMLFEGTELWAAPVAGGGEVEIAVRWMPSRRLAVPTVLEVLAGDRLLRRFESPPGGGWRTSRLPAALWTAGERLVLRCAPGATPAGGGAIVDRVELDWR